MKDATVLFAAGLFGMTGVTLHNAARWCFRKQADVLMGEPEPLAADPNRPERTH